MDFGKAKSLYLKKGPEMTVVNNTIKYIFDEILESFSFVNYYQKSKMNNLYDIIANIINTLAEESFEENYAKFVIKYCRKYKQGNRNIVYTFFSGLNPDNFRDTFSNLKFPENSEGDYYQDFKDYINQISYKNKKSIKNIMTFPTNGINEKKENHEKQTASEIQESKDVTKNSQNINKNDIKNNENNEINTEIESQENYNLKNKNELSDIKSEEQSKNFDFDNFIKQLEDKPIIMNKNLEESIKNLLQLNKTIIKENKEIKQENEKIKQENKKISQEIKEIKQENEDVNQQNKKISLDYEHMKKQFETYKEKSINNYVDIKSELYKLKNEMREISYRDISKPIINNYINEYESRLSKEKNLKNKKDKATKIIEYVKGKELLYYKKIVNKYYDANHVSHISKVFKDFGKKYIIGLTLDKNDLINSIFADYCKIILEENVDESNSSLIDKYFKVKKIIGDLAEKNLIDKI